MKRVGKAVLWLDGLAFVVFFLFALNASLTLQSERLVWGPDIDLWSKNTSVRWPPFWGSSLLSVPKYFVATAGVGCVLTFIVLTASAIRWIASRYRSIAA